MRAEQTMDIDRLQIQHLRHATMIVSVAGKRVLVDPMLASAGSMPPIPFTRNRVNNPLVNFPLDLGALNDVDAVLVTHLHVDHFDQQAQNLLPKDIPILCQPSDEKKLTSFGFHQIIPIPHAYTWDTLTIFRVTAHHGAGVITALMGTGSGYMIQYGHDRIVYLAGDTIYDETFEQNITRFHPHIIIVNAGHAHMLFGAPITMTSQDVSHVCVFSPQATVIAVHMEAINHCGLSREQLRAYLEEKKLLHHVVIPQDGEIMNL